MSDAQRTSERIVGPITSEAAGLAPGRHRLESRRILVVGAGTQPCPDADAPIGNGRAIALLCAREGAAVGCADRDEAAARDTLAQIEKEGGRGVVIVGDVSDEAACARIVDEAEHALGGIDGVVLNVGIAAGARLAGTDAAAWDRDLRGEPARALPDRARGAAAARAGARSCSSARWPALGPGSQLPSYDASKAGLAGLMRHVAYEGARRGVRANVILPGPDRHAARSERDARPAVAREARPCRSAVRAPAGRSRTRRCSCSRARPATSPVSRSSSTAGSPDSPASHRARRTSCPRSIPTGSGPASSSTASRPRQRCCSWTASRRARTTTGCRPAGYAR